MENGNIIKCPNCGSDKIKKCEGEDDFLHVKPEGEPARKQKNCINKNKFMKKDILSIKSDNNTDDTVIKVKISEGNKETLLIICVSYEFFTESPKMVNFRIDPNEIGQEANDIKIREWVRPKILDFILKTKNLFSKSEHKMYFHSLKPDYTEINLK